MGLKKTQLGVREAVHGSGEGDTLTYGHVELGLGLVSGGLGFAELAQGDEFNLRSVVLGLRELVLSLRSVPGGLRSIPGGLRSIPGGLQCRGVLRYVCSLSSPTYILCIIHFIFQLICCSESSRDVIVGGRHC